MRFERQRSSVKQDIPLNVDVQALDTRLVLIGLERAVAGEADQIARCFEHQQHARQQLGILTLTGQFSEPSSPRRMLR